MLSHGIKIWAERAESDPLRQESLEDPVQEGVCDSAPSRPAITSRFVTSQPRYLAQSAGSVIFIIVIKSSQKFFKKVTLKANLVPASRRELDLAPGANFGARAKYFNLKFLGCYKTNSFQILAV